MANRKIAIITHEYPPVIGGAGIYAQELFEGLKRKAVKTDLILLSSPAHANALLKLYLLIRSVFLVFSVLMQKYNSVIINDGRAKRLFALWAPLLNKKKFGKTIFIIHGGELEAYFKNPSKFMRFLGLPNKIKKALPSLKSIIVVSTEEYNDWIKIFPNIRHNLKIIPHGIDGKQFKKLDNSVIQEIKAQNLLSDRDFIIVTASRLVEKKGQDRLLAAISNIDNSIRQGLKLLVIGDGEYRSKLEERAKNLGIIEQVRFLGGKKRSELRNYFSVADLFVLPSRFKESFGLVYIEAMACGVPVIGSNFGGVKDIIEEGVNGYLVNPDNVRELTEIIVKLKNDSSLLSNLKSNAKVVFDKKFESDVMLNRFITISDE